MTRPQRKFYRWLLPGFVTAVVIIAVNSAFIASCTDRTAFGNPRCRPIFGAGIDLAIIGAAIWRYRRRAN